jgi:subtilisin-like proprotein convertase family protein
VDITHTYIGDLKVELVAPDNTARTLHNHIGGSADDIVKTYTPDFGSISINGNWQLRLYDNYDADEGTLNSWSITFGDSSASNPITAVTGSDSQYYVTVASPQTGTYNLDIAEDNDIVDASSNSLSSRTPTGDDQSYTVTMSADSTPTVTSITRHSPAEQNTSNSTLQFSVLFSEAVTGVSQDDFELSSDSPTDVTPQSFTYSSEPSLFVPYDVTKTDTITVSDSLPIILLHR